MHVGKLVVLYFLVLRLRHDATPSAVGLTTVVDLCDVKASVFIISGVRIARARNSGLRDQHPTISSISPAAFLAPVAPYAALLN